MLKVINDDINEFIKFINDNYSINENVYIHICEGYDTIEDPNTDNVGFGVYDSKNEQIYIAGNISTEEILKTIAHEYRHFIQKHSDMEYDENDAESFSEYVYRDFSKTKK